MITKSEWQAVYAELMADERRRLGDPPTFGEVSAYVRGELSAKEEERVRELLACYPELARAIAEPFPAEDSAADRELMSDEELAAGWAALEKRIDGAKVGVLRFPYGWISLAASLMLVFAGLYWGVTERMNRPQIVSATFAELRSSATRGGGRMPLPLVANRGQYQIAVPVLTGTDFTSFRIRIVDMQGDRLWQSEVVERPDRSIAVKIPTKFLDPGVYDIELIGVDGVGREEELVSYAVEVPER